MNHHTSFPGSGAGKKTLFCGLSRLEEQRGEPSHGEQVGLTPQSPAVDWGWESALKGAPVSLHIATGTWLGCIRHYQR